MPRIDLHVHSTYSDGTCSPREVVELAHAAGVTTLSLTDHDTVEGMPEAVAAGNDLGIQIIPGIELSSQARGQEIHILGYYVDSSNRQFLERLEHLRSTREARNPQMVRQLNELGLSLSYDDVLAKADKGSVGRPHIAQVLVRKGYVKTVKEAFDRYLGEGAAAYIPRHLPEPGQVIAWIREAGGLPVLAHPGWVKPADGSFINFCRELRDAGLGGVEVFYSTHTPRQTSKFLQAAKQLGLCMTGGSDFHGTVKPDIHIGVGRGALKVPATLLETLRKAAHC